jgi:polar amino acid transport system substrate-binding protein
MQSKWAESTVVEGSDNKFLLERGLNIEKIIIYAVLFVVTVLFLARKFANTVAIKLDTRTFKVVYFSTLIIIIILSGAAIKVFLSDYKKQLINDQKETFNVTRDVTKKTLEGWYEERELLAKNIAKSERFISLVQTLVRSEQDNNETEMAKVKIELRNYFSKRPYTTQNGRAYTISDLKGKYLLNLVASVEGEISTTKSQRPELFNKILQGLNQFIPPVWANIDLDNNELNSDKDAEIFIATPIKNQRDEVIAVLAFRFDPDREFSRLFIDGRLGETFESYAVDSDGYMVSSGRFTFELQERGMIPIGESSVLNIRMQDPESNPIVHAASFHLNGQNLDGYQNYKGDIVVGQWITFKKYNFTVVSEIELDEVLAEYHAVSKLLFIGLIISSAFIFALSIFMITISNRANAISRRSQNELTEQVNIRTQELAYSEQKSKLITSSVADGIVGVDKKGKFIFANESAVRIFGYSEKEILSHDVISLFAGENQEGLKFEDTLIHKAIVNKEIIRVANEEILISGAKTLPLEYSLSPVEDDESDLACVIALQDITERLKETERLEKMLAHLPVCMVIMNKEDEVEQINQTGVELLGFTREEIVGQPVDLFIPDEQVESHKALLKKFFKEESTIDTQDLDREFRVKHKSGKLIEIQAVYTPVHFFNGTYAAVMVRDITAEKQAETALVEAKRISDDASKAKSDFLANMSHEIRTPMNAIMGMSHLALACQLDRKPHNYVTKVFKAAESLLGIINDILDFSKIEAGKLDIETIDFNLHDTFDDLANIIALKASEKGLELLFDISPDVPTILKGDPLRLNQILINLAGNAVKFTDHGQIVIAVAVAKRDAIEDEITLTFSVTDSGIGMDDAQQQKLFQSFSQADSSITRKYGGTGLGLTISKKLVELMNGEIWLTSEPGVGSCFSFNAQLKISGKSNTEQCDRQKSFLEDKRILIVDDNALALDVLSSILASFHCHVVTASSGEEAIELTKQATIAFDFIMLDWKMPELDGIETYNIIKSQNDYHDNQFILITSNAHDSDATENLKNSINNVLIKPVTSSSIFDEMMRLSGEDAFGSSRKMKKDDVLISHQQKLVGAKILLVEDNELNQELATELLTQSNIIVELAENGAIAVDKVAVNNYDGVLMDLQMPIMDGFTATKIIRENHPDLPIIAMTANAMVSDKEKVIEVGMNAHITKPINVNDMFATIAHWITPANKTADKGQVIQDSSAQDNEIDIPNFKSIDQIVGLSIANGNSALYVKLLGRFIKGQSDFVQRFNESLAKSDKEEIIRFAHTLKGSAGNIGAKKLLEFSGELEHVCSHAYDDKNEIGDLLDKVANELDIVLQELKGFVTQAQRVDTGKASTNFVFTEDVKNQLAELLALVEDFETEALDVAELIIERLKGTKQELIFQGIYQQIEGYEFTEAEAALNAFIESLDE